MLNKVLAALLLASCLLAKGIADPASAGEPLFSGEASAANEQQSPALPTWVKYQWLSWYAAGMAINEDYLKAQVDYISENLADLGPWHILVDAGWYVSEGRPDSDWRNVDADKFPSGLRALVDYAHSRNIRVVLYLSVPYLTDAVEEGNWLALRGIVQRHPDWLIPLGPGEHGNGYLYDFRKPEVRSYWAEVLKDFFVTYDVDGIKVDGFGDADREVKAAVKRGAFTEKNKPSLRAAEIYEFIYKMATALKPDAYIEAGWFPPSTARNYVHTVRYGDEYPAFDYPYPNGGLSQHVDYALSQFARLGQRPNIGAIWGDANEATVGYQWLEAGLALSDQVVLGFDLPSMSPEVLSGYRSRLSQYNAFESEFQVGGGRNPDVFVSRKDGTTYVGAINRDAKTKAVSVDLTSYGLDPDKSYLVYDVASDSYFRTSGLLSFHVSSKKFRLFLLRDEVGLMWTNGSFEQFYTPGQLTIVINGPSTLLGYADIHTPPFSRVYLDGALINPSQYQFDRKNIVLTLAFSYSGPRQVGIVY